MSEQNPPGQPTPEREPTSRVLDRPRATRPRPASAAEVTTTAVAGDPAPAAARQELAASRGSSASPPSWWWPSSPAARRRSRPHRRGQALHHHHVDRRRDEARHASETLKQQLDAADKQFQTQFKDVTYVKSGLYNQDDTDKRPRGRPALPRRQVQAPGEEPDELRRHLNKHAATNGSRSDRLARRRRRQGRLRAPVRRSEDRDLRLGDQGLRRRADPHRSGWDAAKLAAIMRSTCARTSRRPTSRRSVRRAHPMGPRARSRPPAP